jgi:Protein of unknown function (DUF4089)
MTERDDEALKAFIEAGADLLNLSIDPRWLPAIEGNLQVTLRHGALVAELELPDEAEPAPVFKA